MGVRELSRERGEQGIEDESAVRVTREPGPGLVDRVDTGGQPCGPCISSPGGQGVGTVLVQERKG